MKYKTARKAKKRNKVNKIRERRNKKKNDDRKENQLKNLKWVNERKVREMREITKRIIQKKKKNGGQSKNTGKRETWSIYSANYLQVKIESKLFWINYVFIL